MLLIRLLDRFVSCRVETSTFLMFMRFLKLQQIIILFKSMMMVAILKISEPSMEVYSKILYVVTSQNRYFKFSLICMTAKSFTEESLQKTFFLHLGIKMTLPSKSRVLRRLQASPTTLFKPIEQILNTVLQRFSEEKLAIPVQTFGPQVASPTRSQTVCRLSTTKPRT